MIDAQKVVQQAAAEMERLGDAEIILKMNVVQAVRVISMVQLALRHPAVPDENKKFGRSFTDNLIELIERVSPDLAGFCRLGYNDVYDV
jgi:hypothetical protein